MNSFFLSTASQFDLSILIQQLINGVALGSIYGLIAIGYTMVYGIIGLINFAHGDIYMISAYLTAICIALFLSLGMQSIALVLILTLVITIIITGLYGWMVEFVAYRPLRDSTKLAPLISAIGLSLLLQNYVKIAQGASNEGIPNLMNTQFTWHFNNNTILINIEQLFIFMASIGSMLLLTLFIKKTSLGRAMRATQQDRVMATLLGVNTGFIIPMVFTMGAMLAAVAGVLVTLNYGSFNFFSGFMVGIKAFTAAVLGGIGSLYGAMLGGLILGLSETLFSAYVSVAYKDVFAFSLLVSVLVFRPSGLLGMPEVEKV